MLIRLYCRRSVAMGLGGKGRGEMAATGRPLSVEVYSLTDKTTLEDWKPPESAAAAYKGMHGLKMPSCKDGEQDSRLGV